MEVNAASEAASIKLHLTNGIARKLAPYFDKSDELGRSLAAALKLVRNLDPFLYLGLAFKVCTRTKILILRKYRWVRSKRFCKI